MKRQTIQIATNLHGPVRREQYMGREHIVVSATLVKSKVLQNNLGRTFLPAEDVTPAWAEQWNGQPAVVDHPRTSARTPEVMNALGVGVLHRARALNGAIKADVFLDPARVDHVADLKVVLAKLERGEKVEVSTGFPVDIDETPGAHNGHEYDVVIHPRGADHLAVFAEQIGACSVEDGCGLAANRAEGCGCAAEDAAEELPELPVPATPSEAVGNKYWRSLFGKLAKLFRGEGAENESDEDRRNLIRHALIEKFGADDRYLWVDSVFSEDGNVVFEIESRNGGESGLFRADFQINENGAVSLGERVEVRRVTTFEPVANVQGDSNPEEGSTMNREQMIAHLAAAGRDRATLEKLSDCDLKAICGTAKPETASNSDADLRAQLAELQQRNVDLRRANEKLDAETKNAREAEMKERLRLQEDLIYNGRTQFTDDQVRAMDIAMLRQLHGTVFPRRADFSGRGAPAASPAANGSFDFVQGVMSGPAGSSVLDRKEAN